MEKRISRLRKQNTGIVKIARAFDVGTGLQQVVEQMPAYIAVNAEEERAENRRVGPNASLFLRYQKRRAPT